MLRSRLFYVAMAAMFIIGLGSDRSMATDEPGKPPTAQAQGPGRGLLSLLRLEAVVKDLNLTDKQIASLKKIADDANKQAAERPAPPQGGDVPGSALGNQPTSIQRFDLTQALRH